MSADVATPPTVNEPVPSESTSSSSSTTATATPSTASSSTTTTDAPALHPLSNKWVLRFSPTGGYMSKGEWLSDMHSVASVDTVEDFWRLYNSIKLPSSLALKNTYSFFKDGIMPEFEDPANTNGGKINVTVPLRSPVVDNLFMHMLMMLIGQQLPDPNLPTGLYLSLRKQELRFSIWLRGAQQSQNQAAERAIQAMLDREFKDAKLSVDFSFHGKGH